MTVHHQHVIFGDRGGTLGAVDFACEFPLSGIVLHQVRKIVGWNEIVNRHNFHFFTEQALVTDGAKYKTTNAPEAVNTDFNHDTLCWMTEWRFEKEKH
jgi:hypothetical protein